jgi:hypothetical protein
MTTNVLILCTHNSARSVLGEGMLDHWARKLGKDVRAYSAGSAPSGRLNSLAIEALQNVAIETEGYRSKSWDEFAAAYRPRSGRIELCWPAERWPQHIDDFREGERELAFTSPAGGGS